MRISFVVSTIFLFASFFHSPNVRAQFPPGVGHPGTTAMSKDSSAFLRWAKTCQVTRGYVNIADTTVLYNGSNKATYGSETDAVGIADNFVVSLGDGGSAVLTFENPIVNGPGYDFAVFENSLDGSFLELGFVEVSSDGVHFFRFPAISETSTSTQVATFGTIDPTKINNFAGKYLVLYGTPFDLDTLKNTPGLDVNNITHIRIIDVVGDIDPAHATYDSQGHIVNDPWPTPFNTCGFDLDAVGVIHDVAEAMTDLDSDRQVEINPNPVGKSITIRLPNSVTASLTLASAAGTKIREYKNINDKSVIDCSFLSKGFYFCVFTFPDGRVETRKIVKL